MISKFEVTEEDVLSLCVDFDLQEPESVIINDETITLDYDGNEAIDAMKLFDAGLGQLWDYDWTDRTTEHHVIVKSDRYGNLSTVSTILRTV